MPHYKDKSGEIHFVEDEKFKDMLPEGCVKVTDKEAKTALEKKNKPAVNAVNPWDDFDLAADIDSLKAAIKVIFRAD